MHKYLNIINKEEVFNLFFSLFKTEIIVVNFFDNLHLNECMCLL